MSEIAGAGPISLSLEGVRTILVNIAAYRTWLGAATVAAATAKTFLMGEYDANVTLPIGAIFFSPENVFSGDAVYGGAGNFFAREGLADVLLVEQTPAAYADTDSLDWLNALKHITNVAGQVIVGIEQLAGTGAYLNMRGYSVSGAVRDVVKGERDLLKMVLRVKWQGPGNL